MSKIRKDTQQVYAEWLQKFEFTHFVTLTTHYTLTIKSARRLVERWHQKLEKHGYTPFIFWVAEKYECKDGYHIHLLLKLGRKIEPHEFKFICELYQICAGTSKYEMVDGKMQREKWSRIDIQKFNPKLKAGWYVTKYVLKENSNQMAEYDFI